MTTETEMRHTPGLPCNWKIKDGYLYHEENYPRYILDENGRIDRMKVEVILDNHHYFDHAKLWHLTPVQAAAPELLAALKVAHGAIYETINKRKVNLNHALLDVMNALEKA